MNNIDQGLRHRVMTSPDRAYFINLLDEIRAAEQERLLLPGLTDESHHCQRGRVLALRDAIKYIKGSL